MAQQRQQECHSRRKVLCLRLQPLRYLTSPDWHGWQTQQSSNRHVEEGKPLIGHYTDGMVQMGPFKNLNE